VSAGGFFFLTAAAAFGSPRSTSNGPLTEFGGKRNNKNKTFIGAAIRNGRHFFVDLVAAAVLHLTTALAISRCVRGIIEKNAQEGDVREYK
jgi:hypothetical protein